MSALPAPLHRVLAGLSDAEPLPPRPTRQQLDAGLVRSTLGPLFIMVFSPLLVLALWQITVTGDGTASAWLQGGGLRHFFSRLPTPSGFAAEILAGWLIVQYALLRLLPGREHLGPVTPAGQRPRYRANGVAAWALSHLLVAGGWALGWIPAARVVDALGSMLVLLIPSAFVFCLFLYAKGRLWPSSQDTVWTANPLFDFFQGVELHPRMFGVSLKQLLNCRVSMMGWSVLSLLCAFAQAEDGHLSTALAASVTVTVVYLFKFFWWETGYFGSLDIMHDRFGYYICWGVLTWVPGVYVLPAFWLRHHGQDIPLALAAFWVLLGLVAIWVNYAADAQRQRVRETGGQTTVWGRAPRLISASYTASDNQPRTNLLLANGWWGVARHFHYVPELVLAFAWTAPAGFSTPVPWFYVIFLTILLTDRAGRDERRCAAKYGADWERYRQAVRWRMVPGLW